MATSLNSPVITLIFAFAVISPILFIRMRKMRNGVKVNIQKTIVFSALLLAFSIFEIATSFSIANVPFPYALGYVALFGAVTYLSYRYSNRSLYFWQNSSDSSIYVKGGGKLLIFYFVVLVIRIVINSTFGAGQSLAFMNSLHTAFENNNTSLHSLSSTNDVLATIIVDALLMIGVGLIMGRSIRIRNRFKAIMSGRESASDAL